MENMPFSTPLSPLSLYDCYCLRPFHLSSSLSRLQYYVHGFGPFTLPLLIVSSQLQCIYIRTLQLSVTKRALYPVISGYERVREC